jgi:copper chaperone CopZ
MRKAVISSIFGLMVFASSSSWASGANVKVNGMVCAFCANSIEKKFKKMSEVQGIKVDLDSKVVSIDFKDEKSLSDAKIKELIEASGYAVASIEHTK